MKDKTQDMAEKNKELSLEINPETAKGIYSNLAIINHSHSEFVIDFASILPGMAKIPVVSRIIMSPDNAKMLVRALHDNILKYEHEFGNTDKNTQEDDGEENGPSGPGFPIGGGGAIS